MKTINIEDIDDAVEECRCPEPSFCPIATTYFGTHLRERTCLKCWLRYCKDNKITIKYGEEV